MNLGLGDWNFIRLEFSNHWYRICAAVTVMLDNKCVSVVRKMNMVGNLFNGSSRTYLDNK